MKIHEVDSSEAESDANTDHESEKHFQEYKAKL